MRKLNDRWFKEDRGKYKGEELKKEKEATDKAVLNSTVALSRLARMLKEDIELTYEVEEDYDNPAWERRVLAAAAERKALKRVLNLLPSKGD